MDKIGQICEPSLGLVCQSGKRKTPERPGPKPIPVWHTCSQWSVRPRDYNIMPGWLMKCPGPVSTFRPVVHISAQPVCLAYFSVPPSNPAPLGTAASPAAPPVSPPRSFQSRCSQRRRAQPIRARRPSERAVPKKRTTFQGKKRNSETESLRFFSS